MRTLVSIGISCGILCGLLVQFGASLGILAWVSIAAWACYYAAGGKKEGFLKTLPANLSGVLWGVIILFLVKSWGASYALGIVVAVVVALICIQASWKVLSFIPGAFVGAACFFGTNGDWKATALGLIVGAILGVVSEQGSILVSKMIPEKK